MTDTATPSVQGVNCELITDKILQAASLQSADVIRGTKIVISGNSYKYPEKFVDTIRMLLTAKVRADPYRGLRYDGSNLGEHAFS